MFDRLPALCLLTMAACAVAPEPAPLEVSETLAMPIRFVREPGCVHVFADAEWFAQFHVSSVDKPFLNPILGPTGDPVTRGWPRTEDEPNETHDHAHHNGAWFSHGDVNGHDFWHSDRERARIFPGGFPKLDEATQTITSRHEWIVGQHDVLLQEQRTMRFAANEHDRVVDFTIQLKAASGPVTFGDTKEGTFALRTAPTLRVEGEVAAGALRNSEGDVDGGCWGKRARWLSCSGPVGDGSERVSVILFDHPDNPRHPTWWHARSYGLLAANPFGVHDFEREPAGTGDLTIGEGESVTFRYRLQVRRGPVTRELCDRLFDSFAR